MADALAPHLAEGDRAAVAVSGGPDSVALLHLVPAARPDLVLVVVHVRHGLRDDEPDAAAARANAAVLGLEFQEERAHPAQGQGPEDAARRARYAALRRSGQRVILLGHTADDQAETVVIRLARGTGLTGLGAMAPRTERHGLVLLRPLLGLRRAAVREVSSGLVTVTDPSNLDPSQRRARARHEVLPALGRLAPHGDDAVPALVRLAELARAEAGLLDELAAAAVSAPQPGTRSVHTTDLHPVLARRGLRLAFAQLVGRPPSRATTERILALRAGEVLDCGSGVRARGGVTVQLSLVDGP